MQRNYYFRHSVILSLYVNVLKHVLLNDVIELRAACQSLIDLYDGMLNHTTLSLGLLSMVMLMWSALGLERELNQVRNKKIFSILLKCNCYWRTNSLVTCNCTENVTVFPWLQSTLRSVHERWPQWSCQIESVHGNSAKISRITPPVCKSRI